ncbi:hypothetical protein BpHYR1_015224 [Brachionus plicatilis]|uniref:Uncharacterized protein n=1 Tax=Brachionus plicatilis TaxID=10195 RepID=A0A3M7PBU6_BRAPC|nr:hypothetical protein BpHYR1_015224 [Brachionus plicatilis]
MVLPKKTCARLYGWLTIYDIIAKGCVIRKIYYAEDFEKKSSNLIPDNRISKNTLVIVRYLIGQDRLIEIKKVKANIFRLNISEFKLDIRYNLIENILLTVPKVIHQKEQNALIMCSHISHFRGSLFYH